MSELLKSIPTVDFSSEIQRLQPVVNRMLFQPELEKKLLFLENHKEVKDYFSKRKNFRKLLSSFSSLELYLLYALVVMDQINHLLTFKDEKALANVLAVKKFLLDLVDVDSFYEKEGGVIGYHLRSLKLLQERNFPKEVNISEKYYPPEGIDLTSASPEIEEDVIFGIKSIKEMAEIYPVGGAADRLHLQDEKTHFDLPAARLEFLGKTLLEGMIRDLWAKEYLYFKLFGEQVTTPIALMTSNEKCNDTLIKEIVNDTGGFQRPKDSYKFFTQPLVPTFTEEGKWCLRKPMELLLKPGGHGVIWMLALKKKVFKWLSLQNRKKAIVRQINNPMAGVDLGVLALFGIGCKENKAFGFASCSRRVKTSEGMNILKEVPTEDGYSVVLSNIEYCDFQKFGVQDIPKNPDEPYSVFPSNTNILFADLKAVEEVTESLPFPGMLVNFKEMKHSDANGVESVSKVARLELLMQNIADGFSKPCTKSIEDEPCKDLPTFITFNKRRKTISPTKKQFVPGSGLVETAHGCFYDYLKNAEELLSEFCGFDIPDLPNEEDFLEKGPSFLFMYHPALGPLYSTIAQKLVSGFFHYGAELQLEIADVYIKSMTLNGSLIVHTESVLGDVVDNNLRFSDNTGKCILKNVRIVNKGIDRSCENIYWKNSVERKESCMIDLQGNSEFIAEDVTLHGDLLISVKDGERLTAKNKEGEVVFIREKITDAKPLWNYTLSNNLIKLELNQ
ncbi:MAG: hypothetical protein S4CHLAM37_10520 [Chlamydiia bacterium]|nr:hypothetical protein [Chlamydiia bacterium]